jgi:hypothetical protein
MDSYKKAMIANVDTHIMESDNPVLQRESFMRIICDTLNAKMEQTWRVKLLDNGIIRLDSFALPQKNLAAAKCLNASDIPQWIKERLAVLQICEQGTIIEGVGQKVSEQVFYVIE